MKHYTAFFTILIIQLFPLPGQITVSDSLEIEQLQDIQLMLNHNRIKAQRWWYGWLIGYGTATVGQGVVYFSNENKPLRQDMALGAATTFLGAIGQLFTPIVPNNMDIQDFQIPGNITADQSVKLNYYEDLLKEIAIREKKGRSWKVHAVTGAVNISSGLITWLGFKRTVWDGVGNFALNTIITELQIWTQPTRAIKDYQNYCKKYGSGSGPVAAKPEKELFVHVYPGGIVIELNF